MITKKMNRYDGSPLDCAQLIAAPHWTGAAASTLRFDLLHQVKQHRLFVGIVRYHAAQKVG